MPATAPLEITERLAFAREIAEEAGDFTLRYFGATDLGVDRKGDGSPVTVADKGAEELLRRRIIERFPADAILGEEFGNAAGTSGYQWVLDPIDGTKSFIHGVPLYTNLVAILRQETPDAPGEPLAGVINAPATGEMAWAALGGGAWWRDRNGRTAEAKVSAADSLATSLILTSELKTFAEHHSGDATKVYLELQRTARLARTWGDGYGYLLVASGRAEVMLDPVMHLWDAACLKPIIEEAGGVFTDWRGVATVHSGDSVACTPGVVGEVMAVLKGRV